MHDLYVAAGFGFALYFLASWGEFVKAEGRKWAWEMVVDDPLRWLTAVTSSAAAVYLLPDIGPALGLAANKGGAFISAYAGSSFMPKLVSVLLPKSLSGDRNP